MGIGEGNRKVAFEQIVVVDEMGILCGSLEGTKIATAKAMVHVNFLCC